MYKGNLQKKKTCGILCNHYVRTRQKPALVKVVMDHSNCFCPPKILPHLQFPSDVTFSNFEIDVRRMLNSNVSLLQKQM